MFHEIEAATQWKDRLLLRFKLLQGPHGGLVVRTPFNVHRCDEIKGILRLRLASPSRSKTSLSMTRFTR
jgi:hypothetical protein